MHQVDTQEYREQREADLTELVIAARAAKGVQVCHALVQLQDSSAHSLHEDSVVSDQNESGVAACQPFLHPFDSLQAIHLVVSVYWLPIDCLLTPLMSPEDKKCS